MKIKNKIKLILSIIMIIAFITPITTQATTIYKGIDVYEGDNISDYQALKNTGTSVIIQKATQGTWKTDSLLQYRYQQITQNGFKIGYYHFAQYNSANPIGEAQHFLSAINGLHSDTVLWLDIEDGEGSYEWNKNVAIDYTNQFINYVKSQGYQIGIYSGDYMYNSKLKGNIPDVPLWLASYGRQPKLYPDKASWQYSGNGRLDGVTGDVDLDYFNDSIWNNNTNNLPTQSTQVQNNVATNTVNVDYSRYSNFVGSRCGELQSLLNKVGYNLVVDGDFGANTLNAVMSFQLKYLGYQDGLAGNQTFAKLYEVINNQNNNDNWTANSTLKEWQLAYNKTYGKSIKVDGLWGSQTKSAMQSALVQQGSHNLLVGFVQSKVNTPLDYKFGNNTKKAVKQWQSKNGLVSDGKIGYYSFYKIIFGN